MTCSVPTATDFTARSSSGVSSPASRPTPRFVSSSVSSARTRSSRSPSTASALAAYRSSGSHDRGCRCHNDRRGGAVRIASRTSGMASVLRGSSRMRTCAGGQRGDEMKSEVNVTVPPARLVFSPEDRARILGLVDESLQSGSLTLGPMTQRFEEMFAAAHEAPFAVATSSGTSSLEIILRSLGVAGAEVVVPDNTFYATAGAVLHAGGRPRFADVSAQTFAITADSVEAALTPATAGVVIVHIGGLISPEIEKIRQLCD